MDLPADWGGALGHDFLGIVQFARTFHRPTGLNDRSRVWLLIDDVDWQATVALNDQPLGEVVASGDSAITEHRCPARFDITANLWPVNRLSITVTSPGLNGGISIPRREREGKAGGLVGLVQLEIEER
jgi:hypothetical protein